LKKKKEEERLSLDRYLSHYQRFSHYEILINKYKEFVERVQEKIRTFKNTQTNFTDLKYIEEGVQTIQHCFLVLKYSYVQSYFMIEEDINGKKEQSIASAMEKEKMKKRKLFERKKKLITPNIESVLKEYDPKKENLSIGFFIFLLDDLEKTITELYDLIEKTVPDIEEKKKIVALITLGNNRMNNLVQAGQLFEDGLYVVGEPDIEEVSL